MSTRHAALAASLCLAAGPALASPPAPGAVPAPEAPRVPPGRLVSTADASAELPLGGSVTIRLAADGASVFRFNATEPGVLKVAAGGPVDVVLAVATPEGLQAAGGYSDNDAEGDWSERLAVPLFVAGEYLVWVESFSGGEAASAFLAATFEPGEPATDDEVEAESIDGMRALAETTELAAGADHLAEVGGAGPWLHRVDAEPGLYSLTSASSVDLTVATVSLHPDDRFGARDLPDLFANGDRSSDADFGNLLGREALIVEVPEGGDAWVRVSSYSGVGAPYTLRLQPLATPAVE